MALTTDPRTTPILIALVAVLLGYVLYTGTGISAIGIDGLEAGKERITVIRDSIQILQSQTDSAKRDLAKGTAEDLRRRLGGYRASLQLLRRLVPERNEVPNLLDDISTRAKIRGVNFAKFVPLPVEPGPSPFDTYKYDLAVQGRYDQIGEFLSDVASLQRIMVPFDLSLVVANQTSARALGDTSGALLEARFQIRTYVKSLIEEGDRGT